MRVCRKNRWNFKSGVYNIQMHDHSERPALLRSIANKIRLYKIDPELYEAPPFFNSWCVYTFLDQLYRYGQQFRQTAWFRVLPPPPDVETRIELTVAWDRHAPVAVAPAAPPPPQQPVCPAGSDLFTPEAHLKAVQTSLYALPKVVAANVKAGLDTRLDKRKIQCVCGGDCEQEADGFAK
ncbi:hypothetical protein FN846DRAFT_886211 [Sphaerosporella brunnea]|uniref:Uncharacterized protein n=1 Tax=Sphaerosporella brunnea TaxID=1250544 RepID=A0A5J5FB52_9PEZI|nr:hypothetical protein FN846DRAFT_886211 [Sphaerosporella brunnea]